MADIPYTPGQTLVLADILDEARAVTGNLETEAAGGRYVPDAAIESGMRAYAEEIHQSIGTAAVTVEGSFTAAAEQQDYPIADVVGAATAAASYVTINEVYRQAAHVDDATGYPFGRVVLDPRREAGVAGPFVHPGLQEEVFDLIRQQRRYREGRKYSWEVVSLVDGSETVRNLRLYPPPTTAEKIIVRYTRQPGGLNGLPAVARAAAVHAACVAILDSQINRDQAQPHMVGHTGFGDTRGMDDRLKNMLSQRDRYERLFERELRRLPRG